MGTMVFAAIGTLETASSRTAVLQRSLVRSRGLQLARHQLGCLNIVIFWFRSPGKVVCIWHNTSCVALWYRCILFRSLLAS